MHRKRRGLQKVCGILPLHGYLLTRVFRFQEVQGKEEVKEGRIYTKKILCTAFYTTVASLAFGISSGGGHCESSLGYCQNLERTLQKLSQMRNLITKLHMFSPS